MNSKPAMIMRATQKKMMSGAGDEIAWWDKTSQRRVLSGQPIVANGQSQD